MIASLGAVAALACSCANKTVAPATSGTAPVASSPSGALKRLEWAINHEDLAVIGGLLADDFVLVGAAVDSAGNPVRIEPNRDLFLAALTAVFDQASSVRFTLDQNLVPLPDPRPGRNPQYHKQLRSTFDLTIRTPTESFEVGGNLLVFATRGDSAAIPPDLVARGVKPDLTTWWLDRLEDETLIGPGMPAATQPAKKVTLLMVLEYFFSTLLR
jgi:hypothetical protein